MVIKFSDIISQEDQWEVLKARADVAYQALRLNRQLRHLISRLSS